MDRSEAIKIEDRMDFTALIIKFNLRDQSELDRLFSSMVTLKGLKNLEDENKQLKIDNIRHEEAIKYQNKTIENLQCCGNCRFDNLDTQNNGGCFGCKEEKNGKKYLHGWQSKED